MKTFFTLIEVLVTMLIMTVIAALIIGAFHTGLMCYKKTNAFETPLRHAGSAIAVIKEDLKKFVPVNSKRISFENDKMAFYIVCNNPSSYLELVTYTIKNGRLERSTEKYSDTDGGFDQSVSSLILDDVNSLTFNYQAGDLPIKPEKKKDGDKDSKDKKNEKCWPALVGIQGELKGGYNLDTSLLFPLFNPQEKGNQKQ